MISIEAAASHVAFLINKIKNGDNAEVSAEACAFNIGMRKLCSLGHTAFDPDIHEDMVGGLIRGEMCDVIRNGYVLPEINKIVTRARVIPV